MGTALVKINNICEAKKYIYHSCVHVSLPYTLKALWKNMTGWLLKLVIVAVQTII